MRQYRTTPITNIPLPNVHVELRAFDNQLAMNFLWLQFIVNLERLQHRLGVCLRRKDQADIAMEHMKQYMRSVMHAAVALTGTFT